APRLPAADRRAADRKTGSAEASAAGQGALHAAGRDADPHGGGRHRRDVQDALPAARLAPAPIAGAILRPRSLACKARHAPCVLVWLGSRRRSRADAQGYTPPRPPSPSSRSDSSTSPIFSGWCPSGGTPTPVASRWISR